MTRSRPMDVQETVIAGLQQRLHEENQRRFQQIEKNQDNQQAILEEIRKNTAELPALKEQVVEVKSRVKAVENRADDLESGQNKIKGGGALAIFLIGSWEFFRYLFTGK